MRQQKSKSNSILRQVYSGLLKSGCLLLVFIGLSSVFVVPLPLFFSFGIKDKQVEIFVPSFLSWANNVKQGEAKQYVSSLNKGQQAYFAENGAFSTSINALGIGMKQKTETTYYKYSTRVTKTAAFNYAVAQKPELKSYFGGVFLVPANKLDPNARRDEMTTESILCETEKRPWFRVKRTDEPNEPAEPIYQNGEVICGKGTTDLTK